MKRSLRKDKREWANSTAHEAEHAAKHGQMKDVYDAMRKLCTSEDGGEVADKNKVEKKWEKIREAYCKTAKDVLGLQEK